MRYNNEEEGNRKWNKEINLQKNLNSDILFNHKTFENTPYWASSNFCQTKTFSQIPVRVSENEEGFILNNPNMKSNKYKYNRKKAEGSSHLKIPKHSLHISANLSLLKYRPKTAFPNLILRHDLKLGLKSERKVLSPKII